MKELEKTPHPEWALKFRKPGTELRVIKGRYYLYEYKTVYNATTKKPKKITGRCLGAISEEGGFKQSNYNQSTTSLSITKSILVKEYGMSCLVQTKFQLYIQALKTYFPDTYKQILAIAYCRLLYQCPLKNIPYRLEASFLTEIFDIEPFTDKTASSILHCVGGQFDKMHGYMKSFITEDSYMLIDGTDIGSKSENISLVKNSYGKDHQFDGHINLLYIYSASSKMPIFYRLLAGNIKDVKAFKHTLGLSGITQAIIVADKGFYSKANIELLKAEKLSYIIPLKRDNIQIDYGLLENNTYKAKARYFTHEQRIVWYLQQEIEDSIIHLFLDESLRIKEECDYLTRITNCPETYSLEKYHTKRNVFGTIALLTDKKHTESLHVYQTYKSRMFIETMFDGMKNILAADHTYMQNEQTLEGWMFINHICLQWYQELYIELKEKDLIKKVSVQDYINLLTDIKKIKINNKWHLNEHTKATAKLIAKIGIKYNT